MWTAWAVMALLAVAIAGYAVRGMVSPSARPSFMADLFTRDEGWGQSPKPVDPPWLFDLEADIAERYDLAAERPDVVAALRAAADEHKRGVVPVEDQIAKGYSAGK